MICRFLQAVFFLLKVFCCFLQAAFCLLKVFCCFLQAVFNFFQVSVFFFQIFFLHDVRIHRPGIRDWPVCVVCIVESDGLNYTSF